MKVRRLAGAAEFLEATLELRAADPVRTNVLGSVATGVLAGIRYAAESYFVAERDGTVVGAALWTAPYRLLVGPMDDEAARAVGVAALDRAADLGTPLPGVVGPVGTAEHVADGTGREWRTSMAERLLVLRDYRPPRGLSGGARHAVDADAELVRRWRRDFAVEAGTPVHDDEGRLATALEATWFWELGGVPVSMAAHAPIVSTPAGDVGRIGPVYTPVEHRRNGFASGVTAAVVEHLRTLVGTVMLFTDAANPTSNHVYEDLGFVHEGDVVELRFLPL